MERIVAGVVVAVTVAAALALGYRQLRVRQWLKANEVALSPEDITYHRWSIGRRLIGCVLLMLLAAMIAGIYLFNIASGLEELMALGEGRNSMAKNSIPNRKHFSTGPFAM